MARIADFDGGWIGTIGDNEIEIVSTMPDPPKVRLAVDAASIESNLGAVSFNARRPDGTHDEIAYVMGRMAPNRESGALYVALRPAPGMPCREVLYMDNGAIVSHVPIYAPNLGPASSYPRKIALRAMANNKLVCAENAGNNSLIANRYDVGPWETFEVIVIE